MSERQGLSPAQTTLAMLLESSRVQAELVHLAREGLTELRKMRELLESEDTTPAGNPHAPASSPAAISAAGSSAPAGLSAMERVLARKMGVDPAALNGDPEALIASLLEAADAKDKASPSQPT